MGHGGEVGGQPVGAAGARLLLDLVVGGAGLVSLVPPGEGLDAGGGGAEHPTAGALQVGAPHALRPQAADVVRAGTSNRQATRS